MDETCTGSSVACPAGALSSSGTLCRAAAWSCDVAEACSGSSAACPGDGFQPGTTVCRAAASSAVPALVETATGREQTGATSVTTTPLAAVAGDLYVAVLATKPDNDATISGLGLVWNPLIECSEYCDGVLCWPRPRPSASGA